jgi:prevent-host-death family protein
MHVTATEAKNRLGQMLEHCQREPVTIEKSGRRHSVLLSAAQYDALVARDLERSTAKGKARAGLAFYGQHKDWVDAQNALIDQYGIPGEEHRAW